LQRGNVYLRNGDGKTESLRNCSALRTRNAVRRMLIDGTAGAKPALFEPRKRGQRSAVFRGKSGIFDLTE
jgi:hypothetical protein